MKKLVCLLVVFGLTAPLLGANVITFKVTSPANGELQIDYVVDPASDDSPVGIALNVSCSDGATADSADIQQTSDQFDVYIDYVNTLTQTYDPCDFEDPCVYQQGDGHPLADPENAGALAAPAGDYSICAGRLVEDPQNNPADPCDTLINQVLQQGSASYTDVVVAVDDKRGGVVGSAFEVNIVDGDGVPVDETNPVQVLFEIDCWDYDCHECGDYNGDCLITASDVMGLVNAWPPLPYDRCADFTEDGLITASDVMVLVNHWPPNVGCPDCGPCTPIP